MSRMRRPIASLVIAASLSLGCASSLLAQRSVTVPASSMAQPGDAGVRAHTNVRFVNSPQDFQAATPQSYGPPFPAYFAEDPASIGCIYGLTPPSPGCNPDVATVNPHGGSKAIAVVDAYNDPTAYADLSIFSSQFGVAPIHHRNFIVVHAPFGGAAPGSCTSPPPGPKPPVDPTGGWELEESLDIEYLHAMAPWATLYLVEAQSNSYSDLLCAVTVASNLMAAAGGGEVVMPWGSGEFSGETSIDPVFTTPTVVYFNAAGDAPGVYYPSASPNVVSVGGTTLSANTITFNFLEENAWQDAAGGPSAYESRPTYQNGVQAVVGTQRGTPDVAAAANPYTGAWVQDSFPVEGYPPCPLRTPCWWIVGGTSLSVDVWAGTVNVAGSFAASSSAELTKLYADPAKDFTNDGGGSCGPTMGYFDAFGYNFCTGLGSPATYAGK